MKCAGFIDGCWNQNCLRLIHSDQDQNFLVQHGVLEQRNPRRMKLKNTSNSADRETVSNRTPVPIQTLDQIRLERLPIEDAHPA